jgi:hypothetical protein
MTEKREHTPGAKAPLFFLPMRPKAEALGYLAAGSRSFPFVPQGQDDNSSIAGLKSCRARRMVSLTGVGADPFGDGADGYAGGAFGLPGFGVV